MNDLAAKLLGELRRVEDSLEDLPPRTVVEYALLPTLDEVAWSADASDDDELRCDAARLLQKTLPLPFFEVAVEVAREHAIEATVREGQRERVSNDERRVRHPLSSDLDHGFTLIEAHDVA